MLPGFTTITPKIILDRRHAIREALHLAKEKDVVLITGKGTDPYIMEAGGKKTPWSDSAVAAEEIEVLHNTSSKA
jgi:UDP-N-acetylmuramyl tripeptide synthase